MNRKLTVAAMTLFLALGAAPSLAQQAATKPGNGLAVGQNPKLLQSTRDSNAGAGNGADLVRSCKIDFSSGAHGMKFVCTVQEIDPGNSHDHNQSPECDYLNCSFDPQGSGG